MRPSTSKVSLSNRIIVVSRKPHVNQIRRATKHCTLPPGSTQAVSDAVDFLSTGIWSWSHVCQSVSTMAASQSLVHVSPNQLARLYELVSASGDSGENGDEGSLEVGVTGGDEARVDCLSALVPVLSVHPTLQHTAQSAVGEVLMRRGGLSPQTEHSLLVVCGDDYLMLLQLAQLARRNGHRFSRSFYRAALSKVLQSPPPSPPASTTPTASGDLGRRAEEGTEGSSQEMSEVAGELMAMMSGDWDKAVVETEVFWLALHLAREENQVKAIWDEMATSQYVGDESVSVELVRACLRTAGNLRRGTSTHCQSDPSQTVSALVSRLPSRQASVSATAFERVLAVCAESLQLRLAYQTFTSMTLVHGLAPTRRGLQGVGRLLCAPALAANRQWRQLRLAFAYRMLECSVVTFGGWPPAWVFSECARPLTELLGARGFRLMYDLCHTAVVRDNGEKDANMVMEEVWGRGLYHALLQSCRLNHGPRLATFLLNHMTHRGILPNERTFRHLLKFPLSPSDIDDFMVVLARHMHCLSVEETTNLVQPLQSLLQRTLSQTHNTRSEVVVEKAVSKLLEVVSAGSMEQHCLLQLASLTQEHSPPSSFHHHNSSDCDTVYERARA